MFTDLLDLWPSGKGRFLSSWLVYRTQDKGSNIILGCCDERLRGFLFLFFFDENNIFFDEPI